MSLRRKFFAMFALTGVLCVVAVAWIVSYSARKSFDKANEENTAALVAQFRREFRHRSDEVVHRLDEIAASDSATRMAVALSRGSPDYGAYLNQAKMIAEGEQLDFLEFVDSQGIIISSAQWPARFGYKESVIPARPVPKDAFLQRQELPDGSALSLCAIRETSAGDKPLFIMGGVRLDREFLASLELPAGMRVMLYQNLTPEFSSQFLINGAGALPSAEPIAPLIQQVQREGREITTVIQWSGNAAEDETVDAIPLEGLDRQLLGILLVETSRRPYVELRQHVGSAALLSVGAGVVLALLLSGWAAGRVTQPVEQLALAAQRVASGEWNTEVPSTSSDELGQLAESFNHMTHELLDQRERLVQTERVAAWRELARRLAHELKNPLFPLQLTVENLLRAREHSPEEFDAIFRESSSTLLAEIANLKSIIARFSEFSRMPQPQFQKVQLNDVVTSVARLFQAQLRAERRAPIECSLALADSLQPVAADPELLHRVLSNLVLNAMDAMPEGGKLSLRTRQEGDRACLEVSDTGSGLTPEECQRLFTPYYTTKAHGTGLGLAMVQSVISDHGGRISVRSEPGLGTTFVIELPGNADKLQSGGQARGTSQ